jgi:hypothetical protein
MSRPRFKWCFDETGIVSSPKLPSKVKPMLVYDDKKVVPLLLTQLATTGKSNSIENLIAHAEYVFTLISEFVAQI